MTASPAALDSARTTTDPPLSGCRQHPRGSHEVELAIHHLRAFG